MTIRTPCLRVNFSQTLSQQDRCGLSLMGGERWPRGGGEAVPLSLESVDSTETCKRRQRGAEPPLVECEITGSRSCEKRSD